MPIGSKNAWKLGIRLEIRWLSIIFTTPKVAALSMAKLIQFNSIGTHFWENNQYSSIHHIGYNTKF